MQDRRFRRIVPAGTDIVREGEAGDCAYIIERGRVEISTSKNGQRFVLAHRSVGDIFGEMAVVDNEPRSATVTALEECELLVISSRQLEFRLQNLDPILKMVFGVILDRFRATIAKTDKSAGTDSEMRAAESSGEARYHGAIERIKLEQNLRQALNEEQFVLYFQPLISAERGRANGFEGLIRWRQPDGRVLPPGAFIEAMEECGLIMELSRWVVEETCRTIADIEARRDLPSDFCISVNVTSDDIADPEFGEIVQDALMHSQIDPSRLTLEITESSLMADVETIAERIQFFRDLGLGVSIDDFGTGYSSFSYLTRFPVSALKIDKSFIDEMREGEPGLEVVRAMIGLGHALGLKVVAEGVETLEQALLLRRLKADWLQGYHFSRPVPLDEALALLDNWNVSGVWPDGEATEVA